jgi:predicted nucleotidyltransferase
MHPSIAAKRDRLEVLCRRYGVARLAVFGSAARGADFDPDLSDADFLVEFRSDTDLRPLQQYLGLAAALEELLGRPVDLIERGAIEVSRNYIRRRAILSEAETLYG